MSSMVNSSAEIDQVQDLGSFDVPLLSSASPKEAGEQQQGQEQHPKSSRDRPSSPPFSPAPPDSPSEPPKPTQDSPSKFTFAGGFSSWTRGFRLPTSAASENPQQVPAEAPRSTFSLLTGGFGKRAPASTPAPESPAAENSPRPALVTEGALGTFTKGFLDTSRNAVKVVQIKARHIVSQNKRRYQEGTFDLDMTYITENVIAMGFPAGDISSGFLGYVEGLYRNHMEDVVQFFETHHKAKYKVYNLCSERLYDAALFEGKVACFPFNDHNCPPLHLVGAFCQSAYTWLKGNLENVVVVHCKAGKARTGLMISSLLLYLKFFPTAEESIQFYNQKRCVDAKGLILPSQVRYVKYFERILRDFNGETPSGRKCILRGIRLHKCPYWIRPAITISDHTGVLFSSKKHPRTKDMMPEDFWFSAPRRGIVVFALPGERCVADLKGDFKIHFQDRHGDFYCWLNTNMMENRIVLNTFDLDGFEKRKLPSPGFQVEVVILDHDAPLPSRRPVHTASQPAGSPPGRDAEHLTGQEGPGARFGNEGKADDIFTDSEGEEGGKARSHKSSRKTTATEDGPERKLETESDSGAPTTFGAFTNAFSSMRTAMDRVRVTPGPWVGGVAGGRSMSSTQSEPVAAASSEGSPHEPAKSADVDKDEQAVESVEHVTQQVRGTGEFTPSGDEQSRSEVSLPDIAAGYAAGGNEQGPESEAAVEPRLEQHESHDKGVDENATASDFKAIAAANAADPSLFTFGDEEDYESEEEL